MSKIVVGEDNPPAEYGLPWCIRSKKETYGEPPLPKLSNAITKEYTFIKL